MCSRCGANLEPLMMLALSAWRLREAAREALATGDLELAGSIAREAQTLQWTQAGGFLHTFSLWLAEQSSELPHAAPVAVNDFTSESSAPYISRAQMRLELL